MNTCLLNPMDIAWLATESPATPNHVGGLLQFRLPDGAPRDWVRRLVQHLRRQRRFAPPWNRRLAMPLLSPALPAWVEEPDDAIDLDHHLRHAVLPRPGGERELDELVGRLHGAPIDLSRPPWEFTVIEGLAGGRFAFFIKMHHALVDGVGGMKLLARAMCADRAQSLDLPPFWASRAPRPAGSRPPAPRREPTTAVARVQAQARSLPPLARAFARLAAPARSSGALQRPFSTPRSVLNGRVRGGRRFAALQVPLERLRRLATRADATLNDVVLAVCGGALRHHLQAQGQLPGPPLLAGVPVSVRPQGDAGSGNAISFIVATLGTDLEDPAQRLQAIRESVGAAKAHLQVLPRPALMPYTVMLMAPTILSLLAGTAGRTRPMFNVTISNVPGPAERLYFRGAELLAMHPASIVTHGQALNITCKSYAGQMNFGFTACETTLPAVRDLASHATRALQELEARFRTSAPRRRSGVPRGARRARGRGRCQAALGDVPAREAAAPGGHSSRRL